MLNNLSSFIFYKSLILLSNLFCAEMVLFWSPFKAKDNVLELPDVFLCHFLRVISSC